MAKSAAENAQRTCMSIVVRASSTSPAAFSLATIRVAAGPCAAPSTSDCAEAPGDPRTASKSSRSSSPASASSSPCASMVPLGPVLTALLRNAAMAAIAARSEPPVSAASSTASRPPSSIGETAAGWNRRQTSAVASRRVANEPP